MTASARHETRALLRAHLSAASSYRHLTRHCPICHRLLRLAMEPGQRGEDGPHDTHEPHGPQTADEDASTPESTSEGLPGPSTTSTGSTSPSQHSKA
ncbi:DUF6274 family protein [Streptomyces phyllanthi]|uniref:Uncharacterized protein n=1 Tax=Streptomyces phyllanthi TaxID=1803180 RepID=A0A5N8VXF6_9ACTN|nr:DUF6274 family protein [Streptomyces phyllanthi]MPY39937.1 hypothetical protein [Streptomyces phyllanthi]